MGKFKNIISAILLIISSLAIILLFQSCANQLPPGGGEEDKTPPKLTFQSPDSSSLNFRGNSIVMEFDEYVDRRSFQEAFHISPPAEGEINYDWSGKEVEITFAKPLWKTEPNKTFVITVNSNLKDIRGNSLTSPITFAFSTGPRIDKAGIDGLVFNKTEDKPVTILAFRLGLTDSSYEPAKNLADYITETSSEGNYNLTNLSPGKYRIIAVEDDDRNLLYTTDRESYAVLPYDINLEDSAQLTGVDFYMKKVIPSGTSVPETDISDFFKDSLDIVYCSVENNTRSVLPSQSIFFFFNKHKPAREEFVNSFSIKDDAGSSLQVVFNWENDSLVEIFPPGKFGYAKDYSASFKINYAKDSVYNYELKFRTVSANSFGEVKGSVRYLHNQAEEQEMLPVYADFVSYNIKPAVKYSFTVSDTTFDFKNIFEADYSLFSYIDKNRNNQYDYGNPYPFEYSEPFYVYPQKISVKGGWAIENVIIKF